MPANTPGASRKDAEYFKPEEFDRIKTDFNLRRDLGSAEDMEDLCRRIAHAERILNPVTIREDGGEIFMVAGHRRLAALRIINADPAKWGLKFPLPLPFVKLTRLSAVESLEFTADENVGRLGFSTADLAHAAGTLDRHGYGAKDIARILRVGTEARVRQLLQVNDWPQDIINRLHRGEITEELGREMAKLSAGEVAELAAKIEQGEKVSRVTQEAKAKQRERGQRRSITMSELRRQLDALGTCQQARLLRMVMDGYPGVELRHVELGEVQGLASLAILGEEPQEEVA